MKNILSMAAFLTVACATSVGAQEAFVAQVGSTGVAVSVQPPAILSQLPAISLTAPAVTRASVDFADLLETYPLPTIQTGVATADINQNGADNSGMILQTGMNAALISQLGTGGVAEISQQLGTGNRAAIYQQSNNATANVVQSGNNNRALIIH